jgi:hypothetical protein
VLAADAELEVGPSFAADPPSEAHEPADDLLVDRLERAAIDAPLIEIARQESGFDIVAGRAECGLDEIVGPEPRERRR